MRAERAPAFGETLDVPGSIDARRQSLDVVQLSPAPTSALAHVAAPSTIPDFGRHTDT
jgi:hypothetical protein